MDEVVESTSWFRFESVAYAIVFSFVIILWCHYKWNRKDINRFAAKLQGPPSYPIIGSGLEFLGTPQRK
jgi:cytochrome P450 family 4